MENEFETVAETTTKTEPSYYDRLAQAIRDLPAGNWIRLELKEGQEHDDLRMLLYQAMRTRGLALSTTKLDEESLGVRARKDVRA